MSLAPRLDPPPTTLAAEHEYVLARAFGPVGHEAPRPSPSAALACARALELEGRLAARVELQQLAEELGRGPALELFARRSLLTAQSRARAELLREVEGLAAGAGIPSAPLKAAALERRGVVPLGARRAGDLDLLVPRSCGRRLARVLRGQGWCPTGFAGHGHQFAPLRTPQGHVLELHLEVPGLGAPGGRWEALIGAGRLEPDPEVGGLVHRPTGLLLAAHAIVHGLWQHALSPEAYPPTRFLTDLADLAAAGLLPGADALAALVEPRVPRTRLVALLQLVTSLRAGATLPAAGTERDSPGALLAHVLAASLDTPYRRRLQRRERWTSLRSPVRLPRTLWRALLPSAALLELRYGPAQGLLARGLRRLRHPVDLLRRAARLRPTVAAPRADEA